MRERKKIESEPLGQKNKRKRKKKTLRSVI